MHAADEADGEGPIGRGTALEPVPPPVLAISDIIRSAADQASTTWRGAPVPSQRADSPATPVLPAVPVFPAAAPGPPPPRVPADSAFEAAGPAVAEPEDPSQADEPDQLDQLADPSSVPADLQSEDTHWPGARRQIAVLVGFVCVLILAVLLGHRFIPDVMGFGSLIDTFLPWTAVPLLLVLPAAILSFKKWAIGVCLLTCAVWAGDFGPTLLRDGGSGPADIRVLSQNVSTDAAGAPDLAGIARLAEQRSADVVVLQGLSKNVQAAADQAAPARFGYHLAMYEFVVWSRFPIGASQPVDLGGSPAVAVDQAGAAAVDATSGEFGGLLRFTLTVSPSRQATFYAVHLPQPSLSHDGFGVSRGEALDQLVAEVKSEKSANLVVVGDLDVAQTDRAMGSLLGSATGLVSAQSKAGAGFGFTWPAAFPVVRLDDVLTRGLSPVASVVLPAVGPKQAHRPIEADLRFSGPAGD